MHAYARVKMADERTTGESCSSSSETNHTLAEIKRDHSAFLHAFEKYTQFYRILASRQQANPWFLQRNLTFSPRMPSLRSNNAPFSGEAPVERQDLTSCIMSDSWLELSVKGIMEMGPERPADRDDTLFCPPPRFTVTVYCHRSRDLSAVSEGEFLGSCTAFQKPLIASRGRPRKAERISIPTSKLLSTEPHSKVWLEFRVQKETLPSLSALSSESSMSLRNKTTSKKKDKVAAVISMDQSSRLVDSHLGKKRRLLESQGGESSHTTLDYQAAEGVSPAKKRKITHRKAPQAKEAPPKPVYTATLCVFDSRQTCLLEDGQYILLMDRAGEGRSYFGQLSPLTWKSVFGFQDEPLRSSELPHEDSVKLKMNIAWIGGAPQDRFAFEESNARQNRDMRSTYDSLLPNLRRRDAQQPVSVQLDAEEQQVVVYNFLYDGGHAQQTETRHSFRCPWCQIDCRKVLPLLMHLQLNHSRFTFSYTPLHMGCMIDVRVQENWDQQTQTQLDVVPPFNQLPMKRSSITEIITWRGFKRASKGLSDFLPQLNVSVFRTRQYYHTHTHLPMLEDEYDSDSEAEDTPQWIKTKMMQMIDEFSDISKGEKEVMKMWNLHSLDDRIISVSRVPGLCLKFAELNRDKLVEQNLVTWFLIHLARLQELGIITGSCILQVATLLHTGEVPSGT